jgi:hypothetical protein
MEHTVHLRCRFQIAAVSIVLNVLAGALLSAVSVLAGDVNPPVLQSLRFSPDNITTTANGTGVNVTFTATDEDSGVIYFETAFVSPSGTIHLPAFARFAAAPSHTESLNVTLPRFTESGTWTLSHVFLCDSAGNTSRMDTDSLTRRGFPTQLIVSSVRDSVSPKLVTLQLTPARIDTSLASADVRANYTVTDDLSGVSYIELALASPSGAIKRVSAKLDALRSFSGAFAFHFPALSEAGRWSLSSAFLSDAAGNTLALDSILLPAMGLGNPLDIKSARDTISPRVTALQFTPHAIDTSSGPATVKVQYSATDDVSGVRFLEVAFLSPSGSSRQRGTVTLVPATVVSGSMDVIFPQSSEPGRWTLSSAFLSDAAGNTLALDADGLTESGFGTPLEVRSVRDTDSPRLAALLFAPEAVETSRHPAIVRAEYRVTDGLSGVTSMELTFTSPSGTNRLRGSATFLPANDVTNSVDVMFPLGSEPGQWTASVILSDAVGNTLVLDSNAIAQLGVREAVRVLNSSRQ